MMSELSFIRILLTAVMSVVCIIAGTHDARAQLYVQAGLGYTTGVPAVRLGSYRNLFQPDQPGVKPVEVFGSLNQGLSVEGGVGYMLSDVFSIELSGSYTDAPATDRFQEDGYGLKGVADRGTATILDASVVRSHPRLLFVLLPGRLCPMQRPVRTLSFLQ